MFITNQLVHVFNLHNMMYDKEVLLLSQFFKPTIDGTWLGKEKLTGTSQFMEDIQEICGLIQPAADFVQSVLESMPI
mgnify:CR=1 FL=1